LLRAFVFQSWLGKPQFALEGVIHTYTASDDTAMLDSWTRVKHVPKERVIAVFEGSWKHRIRWRKPLESVRFLFIYFFCYIIGYLHSFYLVILHKRKTSLTPLSSLGLEDAHRPHYTACHSQVRSTAFQAGCQRESEAVGTRDE
jgi:hypothetical protein